MSAAAGATAMGIKNEINEMHTRVLRPAANKNQELEITKYAE